MLFQLVLLVGFFHGVPAGLLAGIRCARSGRQCDLEATSLFYRFFALGVLVLGGLVITVGLIGPGVSANGHGFLDELFALALALGCLGLALVPYLVCMHGGCALTRRFWRFMPSTRVLSPNAEDLLRSWFAQYGELRMSIGLEEEPARETVPLRSFRHFRRVLGKWYQPSAIAEVQGPGGQLLQLRPNPDRRARV